MLHLVLVNPEIPQNTGNIGRLCAVTRSRLHLVHPLGFTIRDRHLRRSGMDYWWHLDVVHHASWEAFERSPLKPGRAWLFSVHAETAFWDAPFADGDGLIFGNESSGAPPWMHETFRGRRLRIPQANPELRSLNLATAAGIAAYEALRQTGAGGR